jgi:HSP20 family protein
MAKAIQPWSPFREMEHFRRDFDDLFDRRLGHGKGAVATPALNIPAIESYIEGDKVVIRADLPGVDPKDVHISVTGNLLMIKGSREDQTEKKECSFVCREVSYGSFERSITLPKGVRVEDIKVSYKDGVLELTAPKETAARRVAIEVRGEK